MMIMRLLRLVRFVNHILTLFLYVSLSCLAFAKTRAVS